MGGYEADVIESRSAEDGLESASDMGNSITSKDRFKAKDKRGSEESIEVHICAMPGPEASITITQRIVSHFE